MKNVVFYARYSSAGQTEQSIEGQRTVCKKYAAENSLRIIAEYIDRAKTGTSDNRPQFQQMIGDSETGLFEGVLVYKLDRFARNRYDSAIYKRKLKDNGVTVISATEAITDTPEGIIMEALLEGMDEYYSAELSRKMKRGKAESFRKGKFVTGFAPYGYKVTNHILTIDETTAPIAREIFERYAGGERYTDIVQYLNNAGISNHIGNNWSKNNLSKMLHNTIYKGEYRVKGLDGVTPCPAIVSAELFDNVQERLKTAVNRRREVCSKYSYVLTGRLYCAECMKGMCGDISRETRYYRCRRDKILVKSDDLHEKIKAAVRDYLTADKTAELAKQAYSAYIESQPENKTETIKRQLAGIETKIQNAVNAIVNGADLPELTDKLNELNHQRDRLRRELTAEKPQYTLDQFTAALTGLRENVTNIIADKVYIYKNSAIICINLTDDRYTPTKEEVLAKVADVETPPTLTNTTLILKIAV